MRWSFVWDWVGVFQPFGKQKVGDWVWLEVCVWVGVWRKHEKIEGVDGRVW